MGKSSGLIYSGKLSKLNQFPWMAIVQVRNFQGLWGHYGSGSLITHQHVIVKTNAVSQYDSMNHFIADDVDDIRILLGTTKYDDLSEPGSMKVGVTKIVNHPNARSVSIGFDINVISVVTLDRVITFTEFIKPVCLWPFGDDLNEILGRHAYAVGYSKDASVEDTLTRKHIRTIVTNVDEKCEENFGYNVPSYRNELKLFCVIANDGESPCGSDDQLYMKIDSKWYLKGILIGQKSFNYDNICALNFPTLYQDIAQFVPWILNQI